MKDKYVMNSIEYWEERFNTDWHEYNGNEQTSYFATMLCKMLPEWLIHEINDNCYEICDLGCAEGDALQVYERTFVNSALSGEDISQKAIEDAKRTYPTYHYCVGNIIMPEGLKKYPVIICSNVVEHFKNSYHVFASVCERSTNYTIFMFPYREPEGVIEEHEQFFSTQNIPLYMDGNYLTYAKTISCKSVLYPYEQIILVYSKNKKFSRLSDVVENVSSDREADLFRKVEELTQQIEELHLAQEHSELRFNEEKEELQKKFETKRQAMMQELAANQQLCVECQNSVAKAQMVLRQKDEYIVQTMELCNHFATGKLMQLNHFLFRVKGQLLKGTKEERKEFWAWLTGRIKKTNHTIGEGKKYNPWMVLNTKLRDALSCTFSNVAISTQAIAEQSALAGNQCLMQESNQYSDVVLNAYTSKILSEEYSKYDVIMLSVIDYDFRHQRPQHFATRFAENGHRVFYVNANFVRPYSVTERKQKLYITDFLCEAHNAIYTMKGQDSLQWMQDNFDKLVSKYAIRDAVVVVDYPNWVYGAEYLRKHYGFKIVTDYMDDFTGFLGTAEDFLKDNCIRLLQKSDMVVASSQFLYEVACKHTSREKISIIRNATEVEHFYQAVHMQTSDKQRKVIGYYGAVSHWFAWKKICHLAKAFPDCDVVIVGAVTEHGDKLRKCPNVKLLGEKSYSELPAYLADFDVCLIPFDTSTDLIKATNPVKFYEYLSAGKKIVATEIPELMPYRDEYVYMTNDDKQFADYVRLCLEGIDTLKGHDECVAFAKANDWQERYERFSEACTKIVPKVSVIVLTYNNLALNKKCIESILKKTAYPNYELIVVDNCSTDGTVEYLQKLDAKGYLNVRVLFNKANEGFAAGNNIGIEQASGDYVLLLNNDTVVSRGWLTSMVKHLENNPHYGMCNPVTNSIGNESMIRVRYTNEGEMDAFAYSWTLESMGKEYTDVERLPLFATLIRKKVIDEVGMLDDAYKVGMFEDDDYTEAVKKAGYEIVIVDDAFVHHVNNASFKKLNDEEYRKIFEENKRIFEKKWKKTWVMPKYREGVSADCNAGQNV